ncbi:MAG TPA: NAD(P)H-dependent oxidoreductase [Actinomycetota bacterium]|nr:NAD(P)H-dependent oxidoreductase [Actinomycetota bacterium]
MSDGDFSILGMAGSLRRRSFNRALLREASELSPEDIRVDIFELAPVPPYNADLDESLGGGPYPQPVRELREGVDRSDAVLMVVPEYNWGPSGVLKNAVDWLSRPAGSSPLYEKPLALAGASPGPAGTGRAQLQLRQNLLSTNSFVLQTPTVQLGHAGSRFDEDLRLVDEEARRLVRRQLNALRDWARTLRGPAATDRTAIRLS